MTPDPTDPRGFNARQRTRCTYCGCFGYGPEFCAACGGHMTHRPARDDDPSEYDIADDPEGWCARGRE